MTWFDELFGPLPKITPAQAGRALGSEARRLDRERIAVMTARLKAGVARGEVADLGWR